MTHVAQEAAEAALPLNDRPTVDKMEHLNSGGVYEFVLVRFGDGSVLPFAVTRYQWEAVALALGAVCDTCGRPTNTPPECGVCWFNHGVQKDVR